MKCNQFLPTLITGLAVSFLAAGAGMAQPVGQSPIPPEQQGAGAQKLTSPTTTTATPTVTSPWIGATVKDLWGQPVGKINNVVFDPNTGQALFGVIALSLPGHQGQLTAVPWSVLRASSQPGQLDLTVDSGKLAGAPTFTPNQWPDFNQPAYTHPLYSYYRAPEPKGATAATAVAVGGTAAATGTATGAGVAQPVGQSPIPPEQQGAGAQQLTSPTTTNAPVATVTAPATATTAVITTTRQWIGAPVNDLWGQPVGKVSNIVYDPSTGQTEYAVIALNMPGYQGQMAAVPWPAVRASSQPGQLSLTVDSGQLAQAPMFTPNQWPDFNQPAYTHQLYSYYRAPEPKAPAAPTAVGAPAPLTETTTGVAVSEPSGPTAFPRPQPDGRNVFPQVGKPHPPPPSWY